MARSCHSTLSVSILLITIHLLYPRQGCAQVYLAEGLPNKTFYSHGDVMIGVLSGVTGTNGFQQDCSEDSLSLSTVEYLMLLSHIIDDANAAHFIHPNWTIGFKAIDSCRKDTFALAQAPAFLPSPEGTNFAAIICCSNSASTALVSSLTSVYQIPQLSYSATSDALSDKLVHKYYRGQ